MLARATEFRSLPPPGEPGRKEGGTSRYPAYTSQGSAAAGAANHIVSCKQRRGEPMGSRGARTASPRRTGPLPSACRLPLRPWRRK